MGLPSSTSSLEIASKSGKILPDVAAAVRHASNPGEILVGDQALGPGKADELRVSLGVLGRPAVLVTGEHRAGSEAAEVLVRLLQPGLVALGIVVVVLPHPSDRPVAPVSDPQRLAAVLGVGDGECEASGEIGCFVHAGIVQHRRLRGSRCG